MALEDINAMGLQARQTIYPIAKNARGPKRSILSSLKVLPTLTCYRCDAGRLFKLMFRFR